MDPRLNESYRRCLTKNENKMAMNGGENNGWKEGEKSHRIES